MAEHERWGGWTAMETDGVAYCWMAISPGGQATGRAQSAEEAESAAQAAWAEQRQRLDAASADALGTTNVLLRRVAEFACSPAGQDLAEALSRAPLSSEVLSVPGDGPFDLPACVGPDEPSDGEGDDGRAEPIPFDVIHEDGHIRAYRWLGDELRDMLDELDLGKTYRFRGEWYRFRWTTEAEAADPDALEDLFGADYEDYDTTVVADICTVDDPRAELYVSFDLVDPPAPAPTDGEGQRDERLLTVETTAGRHRMVIDPDHVEEARREGWIVREWAPAPVSPPREGQDAPARSTRQRIWREVDAEGDQQGAIRYSEPTPWAGLRVQFADIDLHGTGTDAIEWVDVPATEDGGGERSGLDKLLEIAAEEGSHDPRARGVTDKEVILRIVEEIADDHGISTAGLDDSDRAGIVRAYRDGDDDGDR